jgi:replicative DNA helicase
MATRRRLLVAASVITSSAWDQEQPLPDILENARTNIYSVAERQTGRGLAHISGSIPAYMEQVEERAKNPNLPGLTSGFYDIDKLLNGFQRQHLVIIAGRPGMGKTALMLSMVDNMTIIGRKRGAFYSLEMSRDELITRLLSRRLTIDSQRLDRGELAGNEWERFYEESGRLSASPLFIDDRAGASLTQIRSQAMKQVLETGLDYIMIDYLGLVTVSGSHSRYEQVSEAARFCKNLAKELDIPVIVASQLNRGLESRADKRPQMADLRDSGEIEEAANVILGIYRDDFYNPGGSDRPNMAEIEALKNRNGPTGTADLFWAAQLATFRNLSRQEIVF